MAPAPKHSHAEEQQLILDAAIRCIETSSIMDFTMSSLAKEAGLSMGSIYKHIRTKEDVMVALATEMYKQQYTTFEKILNLPMPFPVRLICLQMTNEASACCYEFGGQLDMLVGNEAFLKRASQDWLEKMMSADIAVEDLVSQSLLDAVDNGELAAKPEKIDALVEEILLGKWSMCVGFIQVARQRATRHLVGKGVDIPFPLDVEDAIVQSMKRLLNTYPWAETVTDQAIQAGCEMLVEHGLR